jgi:hypothetical protein
MTPEEVARIDVEMTEELRLFREKYPEYLIDVWGPYDFVTQLSKNLGQVETGEFDRDAAKNWHHWTDVVEILRDCHDAAIGTNWETIRQAVEEIERYASK